MEYEEVRYVDLDFNQPFKSRIDGVWFNKKTREYTYRHSKAAGTITFNINSVVYIEKFVDYNKSIWQCMSVAPRDGTVIIAKGDVKNLEFSDCYIFWDYERGLWHTLKTNENVYPTSWIPRLIKDCVQISF